MSASEKSRRNGMDRSSALWPSVNSPHFLLIGTPDDRRVILFQEALNRLDLPAAQLVSYQQIISGEVALTDHITPTTIVRIESPGKSTEAEHALLRLGADEPDPEGELYERLSPSTLTYEKGRLLASRQWYLGLSAVLRQIASSVSTNQMMNRPNEI